LADLRKEERGGRAIARHQVRLVPKLAGSPRPDQVAQIGSILGEEGGAEAAVLDTA